MPRQEKDAPASVSFPKRSVLSVSDFELVHQSGEVHSLLRLLLGFLIGDDALSLARISWLDCISKTESGSRTEFGIEPYTPVPSNGVFGLSECFYTTAKPPYAEDSIV